MFNNTDTKRTKCKTNRTSRCTFCSALNAARRNTSAGNAGFGTLNEPVFNFEIKAKIADLAVESVNTNPPKSVEKTKSFN